MSDRSKASRLRAVGRGLRHAVRRPRPSQWTRAHAVAADVLYEMLVEVAPADPDTQRAWLDAPKGRAPRGRSRAREQVAGLSAYRYSPSDADTPELGSEPGPLIVHFHGGGYVVGGVEPHDPYLYRLAHAAQVPVLSVDYRLAPEHPCPAAMDDGVAVVHALVAAGYAPEQLVLAGDSAGGGLVLGALVTLRDGGGPTVAGASLGSPWSDLSACERAVTPAGGRDMLAPAILRSWAQSFAGDRERRDSQVSPAYADLRDLPPLQVLCGEYEVLRPSILALAQRARAAGVDVDLLECAQAVHCWYLFDGQIPGAPGSVFEVARFVQSCLSGRQRPDAKESE